MGKKNQHNSVKKTIRECQAMVNYAMAKGQKIPPHVLASLEKHILYQDFKANGFEKNVRANNRSTTSDTLHPFLSFHQPKIISSGAARMAYEEEMLIPSEEEMVNELSMVHQDLSAAVYPASPSTIVLLEDQKKKPLRFLGPVPLIQRMTFVAIISLLAFLGLFMFDEVTPITVNGNILDYQDPRKFLLNELFILAIAAAGASFYALFEAYKYISNASFDAKYESMYWIRFILGVLSGVILAQFIFIDPTVYGGPSSETTTTSQSLGGFITYKPILAFLGGFSARVVHKILNSLVDSLETFISGSARDMLRAREESAKVQMEERINNMKRENAVNDTTNRFNEAIKLMHLQRELNNKGVDEHINATLEAMIQDHLSTVNNGLPITNNFAPTPNNQFNSDVPEHIIGDDVFPGDLVEPVIDPEMNINPEPVIDDMDLDINPDDIPEPPADFK